MSDTLSIALDARDSDRSADAYRILLAEGYTLHDAHIALIPRRLPQIGDVLACGWGYEQTRYDFYQVVRVTRTQVRLRKLEKRYISHGAAPGEATVMPVVDAFVADYSGNRRGAKALESIARRFEYCANSWDERPATESWSKDECLSKWRYRCSIESYSTAYLWDGTPCRESGDY